MSTPAEVITQLKSQLAGHAGLSYVKRVLLGLRNDITQFPSIVIEPVDDREVEERYPTQTLYFTIMINGCISVTDKDKQIIGDETTKGILDLENDIKLGIDLDRTLGGKCIHCKTIGSKYFSNYPYREVGITLEVEFDQYRGIRT
jgi:hypothetical protein